MELQSRVKDHLLRYGIKKKYFASYLGIHPCQLSCWLAGRYELKQSQIQRVEAFLNGNF